MSQTDQEIFEKIKAHNLKATDARLKVFRALRDERKPASVEDLQKHLPAQDFDTVTLYRTLQSFEENGLIRRVNVGHRHAHYELNLDHHHHVICKVCGDIQPVNSCHGEMLEKRVSKEVKNFSEITSHSLEFFGICNACAAKK